jgi:hypothetical protein
LGKGWPDANLVGFNISPLRPPSTVRRCRAITVVPYSALITRIDQSHPTTSIAFIVRFNVDVVKLYFN